MSMWVDGMSLLLVITATLVIGTASAVDFPPSLTLKAGVLLSPPFAVKDGSEYTGFQPDLLDAIKVFASEDGTDLTFELTDAPAQYNAALDLVANDCGNVTNNTAEECGQFDMIVADYFVNADRSVRTLFTPAWLHTSIGALKIESGEYDFLEELEDRGGTVCVQAGTLVATLVADTYPGANTNECNGISGCVAALKVEACSLYVDDALLLRYQKTLDSELLLTRESFNSQYLVWPTKYPFSDTSILLNRWMYTAVATGKLDELVEKYFGTIDDSGPTPLPPTTTPTPSPAGSRRLASAAGFAASLLFF